MMVCLFGMVMWEIRCFECLFFNSHYLVKITEAKMVMNVVVEVFAECFQVGWKWCWR